MQELDYDEDDWLVWYNIENEGWGVTLTDKESTNPVTTPTCSFINGNPVVSMSNMFAESAATR